MHNKYERITSPLLCVYFNFMESNQGEKQHDNQATKLSADCNSGQHRVSRSFTDMVVMVLSPGHRLQDDRWSRSKRSQTKNSSLADCWGRMRAPALLLVVLAPKVTGTGSKTACLKDERGEKQHDNQATKLSADCNSGQHRVSRSFTDMAVVMVLSPGHQLQDDRWSRSKRSQTKVKYIALNLEIWKYLFTGKNNVFPRGAWEKHHSDPDLTSITRPGVEPQGNLSPTTMGSSLGAEGRAVLGRLTLLWALVVPGIQQEIRLSQRSVMVGSAGGAMTMPCSVSKSVDYVHWFRQLEGQAPERLLYLALSKRDVQWDSVLGDKNLPTDIVPKPTIFLPSINEVNHQQTATYLCLLENFFPDVIKVSWKEKNGKRVLPSQQGNTMKTNNTYMKFSWLTVTEDSMKKEHMCIVRLEKNAGGKDQEILFPAVNEVFSPVVATTEPPDDCLQDESEVTDTDFTKVCSRGESEVTDSTKACLKDENRSTDHLVSISSAGQFACFMSDVFTKIQISLRETSSFENQIAVQIWKQKKSNQIQERRNLI
ncbi:hypothetical protein MJG53_006397 [Ovis ammon polii x Ovis aries]|uniref:Uncharacterized protein n=1 Tax=Ovis ammon polii x Ovis aries TaxID=2918886 RepID=A0ACB9V539_9CETA|nr:hypothetical protein MJG53_006397 [Ovis ammon polii x Ovis aries]